MPRPEDRLAIDNEPRCSRRFPTDNAGSVYVIFFETVARQAIMVILRHARSISTKGTCYLKRRRNRGNDG